METPWQILFLLSFLQTSSCQMDLWGMSGMQGLGGLSGMGGMAGMNFMNPFGSMGLSGLGNGFGQRNFQPPPDPAAMREAQMTRSEEQLGELLTESAKNDPGRQRVERLLRRSGGSFTGEAASLNYLVNEYQMTTPGIVPPPMPAPNRNSFPATSTGNNGGGSMGHGHQMGPNGLDSFGRSGGQAMGGPFRQGPNTRPNNHNSFGNQGGPAGPPKGSRRGRHSRRGRRPSQPRQPTTTAIPEWERWLVGSQAGGRNPKPPTNNPYPPTKQRPGPPRRQGGAPPPWRSQSRRQPPLRTQKSQPPSSPRRQPPSKVPNSGGHSQWAPKTNQSPSQNPQSRPTPSKTSKASNGSGQKRTSIAVERLRNIQRRIDKLLKAQPGAAPGVPNQQLDALKQIRDILSGKMIKPIGQPNQVVGPPANTNQGPAPQPQSQPPYDTFAGPPPNRGPAKRPTQLYPPQGAHIDPYSPAQNPPAQNPPAHNPLQQNPPADYPPAHNPPAHYPPAHNPPARQSQQNPGNAAPLPPSRTKQGNRQRPQSPSKQTPKQPSITTVAPKLGDVRYMGNDKYVYTDADNFDVFQWVKVTQGPPPEHQPPQGQPKGKQGQQQQQGQQQG